MWTKKKQSCYLQSWRSSLAKEVVGYNRLSVSKVPSFRGWGG